MAEDEDFLSTLLAAGIIAVIGYGVYKVLKTIGDMAAGVVVTEDALRRSVRKLAVNVEAKRCESAGCAETSGVQRCGCCGRYVCRSHRFNDRVCYFCDD